MHQAEGFAMLGRGETKPGIEFSKSRMRSQRRKSKNFYKCIVINTLHEYLITGARKFQFKTARSISYTLGFGIFTATI
jgi:hypothetical protein